MSVPSRTDSLDLFDRIRQRYTEMSPSFKKVADYMLVSYRDAAFLPASRVAMRVSVSESVVVRFAAALGYSGYPEMLRSMQRIIKGELAPAVRIDTSGPRSNDMSSDDILHRVITQDIANLQTTLENPANAALDQAIDLLAGAREVYCVGLRGLANLAGMMGFLLQMPGIRSKVIVHGDASLFERLFHIGEGDVLVSFAFQRYTRRTVEAMELAARRGAKTITITDALTAPAAQVADVALVAGVKNESFFNSYTAAVSLINSLVTILAHRNRDASRQSLQELESLLPEEDFFAGT
ncbi:MAG: MurR/RpiR family transcriptional regulator [Thermaerobacterales bacterium]